MSTANPAIEQIARAVDDLPSILGRFLPGFDDTNRAAQTPDLPNHVIWSLGHLALYHHRAAERIEGVAEPGPLPEDAWVTGDGTAGGASRFDTESVCFASTPSPDASMFPTLDRGITIHAAASARLAAAVRSLDDAGCQREIPWGPRGATCTAIVLATRMIHHTGSHVGQILDTRRALGLPRLIG